MRSLSGLLGLGSLGVLLTLSCGPAWSQHFHRPGSHGQRQPDCPPVVVPHPYCPPSQMQPVPSPAPAPAPTPGKPSPTPEPSRVPEAQMPSDAFLGQTARGTDVGTTAVPTMLGDLGAGGYYRIRIGPSTPGRTAITASVPLASRGAFKIAENESPRPLDRIFFNYSYFNRVKTFGAALTFGGGPITSPTFDIHREVIGFEKTFLDGDASIGMRLPFFQQRGEGDLSLSDIGDLSIILKYAFYNNRATGDVLSAGMVITTPTGPDFITIDNRTIHPVLLQPFVGFIMNSDNWYLHGFTSVVVPTDSRDVTLLSNDFGVGYRLYQGGPNDFLSFLIPTVEAHITTPLNHRGLDNVPIGFPDIAVITAGSHVGLARNSVMTLGIATPVTGPRPFSFEGTVQLNVRF